MITKWIHINDLGGDPWVKPILSARNDAIKKGKLPEPLKGFGELPLYIITRLTMLPHIFHRLNTEARELHSFIVKSHKPEHIFTNSADGYVLDIDEDLKYKLLIDIDSFLFEVNTCTELIKELFSIVCCEVGKEIPQEKLGKAIQKILAGKGQDTNWFKLLDEHRNFFMHTGTPYLAVDISNEATEAWDLIIMKENLTRFDDATKFMMYADLRKIDRGFKMGKSAIQEHLIKLYQE
jgi:hypothetical protein